MVRVAVGVHNELPAAITTNYLVAVDPAELRHFIPDRRTANAWHAPAHAYADMLRRVLSHARRLERACVGRLPVMRLFVRSYALARWSGLVWHMRA